ncbi:MAG: Flp pilus assembly protein CpaB [Anaerolineales bacterium]|nr:Flp pilus assembly protein CpaB [Anaerolineales bacterium]
MSAPKKASILPVIILAGLAFVLTVGFLYAARAETAVVVAARSINIGARLTTDDVTLKQLRTADVPAGALTSVEAAIGQVINLQRGAGDVVTGQMLGSEAVSAIASGLAPNSRAVAVKVTRSSGLAGLLRPGDFVSLIAVVNPPDLNQVLAPPAAAVVTATETVRPTGTPAPAVPTPIVPKSPFARLTATGLKVLLVPQTFRYEEVTATEKDGFAQAQTSQVGQQESVIVLEVPAEPVQIDGPQGPLTMTLPELIALLDTQAKLYLALEPAGGASAAHFPGVAIEQIVDAGVGGK